MFNPTSRNGTRTWSTLAGSNGWPDVCGALTELRHGLVHPTRQQRRIVLQAHDAWPSKRWQVSLWLQELALLYLLKYRGDYTGDRSRAQSVSWKSNLYRDRGGFAWLRFQVVNSLDFLTPGLAAVPGDPTTVGIGHGPGEQLGDAVLARGITSGAAAIRRGPWEINLVALPESSVTYNALKENGGYAFTHVGQIKRTDGTLFATQDVAPVLTCLAYFLSLVRGAACSLPIQWGGDADGRIVWRGLGSPIRRPVVRTVTYMVRTASGRHLVAAVR